MNNAGDNTLVLVALIMALIGISIVAVQRTNERDDLRLQLQECHASSTR